jgi:hypothetical protein
MTVLKVVEWHGLKPRDVFFWQVCHPPVPVTTTWPPRNHVVTTI